MTIAASPNLYTRQPKTQQKLADRLLERSPSTNVSVDMKTLELVPNHRLNNKGLPPKQGKIELVAEQLGLFDALPHD